MAIGRNFLILLRGIISSLLQLHKARLEKILKKYTVETANWNQLPRLEWEKSQEDFVVYHLQVSLKFRVSWECSFKFTQSWIKYHLSTTVCSTINSIQNKMKIYFWRPIRSCWMNKTKGEFLPGCLSSEIFQKLFLDRDSPDYYYHCCFL